MTLTPRQRTEIESNLDALFERVRVLRDEYGEAAPPDELHEFLFTDLDDYPALDGDEEVNMYLFILHGLAIGLGFESSFDLYRAFCADSLALVS